LYFALRALIEVARRFDRREDPPSSYRLAEQFGATDPQMLRILRRLEDVKLVKQVGGEWAGFVPGCDPDRITIEEVIQHMEGNHRGLPDITDAVNEHGTITSIFERLHSSTNAALNRQTIGHLVRDIYAPRAPS